MTDLAVAVMPAGRDMDLRTAEEVLGWKWVNSGGVSHLTCPEQVEQILNETRLKFGGEPYYSLAIPDESLDVPHYSTDIAAAFQVVDRLTRSLAVVKDEWILDRLGLRCCEADSDGTHGEWRCFFSKGADPDSSVFATGDTPALAICRAALLVVQPQYLNGKNSGLNS